MATNDRIVRLEIKDIHDIGIACAICSNTMPTMRGRAFPICNDCLKELREIIKERRQNEQELERIVMQMAKKPVNINIDTTK